ncbi:DUF6339 family protein [Herbiconiux daphne]|uniref:DUF6339 family protein n=1 Tax=Herbiconiux daphne TaxID=2970914 RepID=A0ABT2H1I4_9MICO|nr:DUF6339 family protein [Herbiconiux daphne]MCS5733775.1 DUF6339 family protein [Herbiconiux daphne]
MTLLLPRLPFGVASALFDKGLEQLDPSMAHPAQVYSPIGGSRADEQKLSTARAELLRLAGDFGFPTISTESARIAFDRAAADLMVRVFDLTWAEAGARDIWSFLSIILFPDVTRWRFHGSTNRERWVATDLTRHAWSRLWWQATVFKGAENLLLELTESDLNQLLERRSIGGDPRLVQALGRAVVDSTQAVARRELIRDSTARIRRRLAFVDVRSLDDEQVAAMCDEIVRASSEAIRASR